MKKLLNNIILAIVLFIMPFIVSFAEVKEGTKVLIWTTSFDAEGESDNWYGWYSNEVGRLVKKIYDDEFEGKVTTDIVLGYDTLTRDIERTTLPSLDDYSLVFVTLPSEAPTKAEIAAFQEFTSKGGRIVLMGEHNGYSPEQIKYYLNLLQL